MTSQDKLGDAYMKFMEFVGFSPGCYPDNDPKWPLKLDAARLSIDRYHSYKRQNGTPEQGVRDFRAAIQDIALRKRIDGASINFASRHNEFFDQLRGSRPELFAHGTTKEGIHVQIDAAQWDRSDLRIDLASSSIWREKANDEGPIWTGVTLRQETGAASRAGLNGAAARRLKGQPATTDHPAVVAKGILDGHELDQEIRDAIRTAIKETAERGGKKLNVKEQRVEAMKILHGRGVRAKTGGLQQRIENNILMEPEFVNCRGALGVRVSKK